VKFFPGEVPEVKLGGLDEKGNKILIDDKSKHEALYGMPLQEIENQKAFPSDHLPITVEIQFTLSG